jgi:FAD/FMN-containing dehydrogenase
MLGTHRLAPIQVDVDKRLVTAQGGIRLSDLNDWLTEHGLCLRNCGSISEQVRRSVMSEHLVRLLMLRAPRL